MATDLYQVLGLDKNATPEDIRKAYKRRALQTHPDRQPPGISQSEKASAEEQFRKVNNAYEVLSNVQNRQLYDRVGVWPPPDENVERETRRRNTYDTSSPYASDPFLSSPFGSFGPGSRNHFVFTDPFELFNSLLGELNRSPFFADPFTEPTRDPFGSSMWSPFGLGSGSLFGPGPMFPSLSDMPNRPGISSYSSVTRAIGQNGQWVSQSQMKRTINGRTETIITRRDAQGNEHVTYSSPEGERYTINGVDQPHDRAIASGPPEPPMSTRPAPPPAVTATPHRTHSLSREQVPHAYQPQTAQYPYTAQNQASQSYHPVPQRQQTVHPDSRSAHRTHSQDYNHRYSTDRDVPMPDAYLDTPPPPPPRTRHHVSHHDRDREPGREGKRRWPGGWMDSISRFLKKLVRRHDVH